MNLEELKSKAKAATPGPWDHEENYPCVHTSLELSGENITRTNEVKGGKKPTSLHNAIYIAAASPDVILKLIERIEDAEGLLKRLTTNASLDWYCSSFSKGTTALMDGVHNEEVRDRVSGLYLRANKHFKKWDDK